MTSHETAVEQAETIAFLSSPAAHGGLPVERIDTHASILFLAGDHAWKLKRSVRYDYLDYSTPERRRTMCEAEFALCQPNARDIYRHVTPVTRNEIGRLTIGGAGQPVDWLIEMARFRQEDLLDRLAARDALDPALMPALAAAIAHAHEIAERRTDRGGHAGMVWVIEGNAAGFLRASALAQDSDVSARVTAAVRESNDRLGEHLDRRRRLGFVRRCHGDLHLGNIVRFHGRPTLFDAVEFNDAISCIDVMYDLAFLLMDLGRLSLWSHANVLLNTYLADTLDFDSLAALPLFLACRAGVRAKTVATAATFQDDGGRQASLAAQARNYLALAERLIDPPAAALVAIGGLSGAGKSALALAIAPDVGPAPGAVVIRSDEVRKQLFGVAPLTRLGAESYTRGASSRVYSLITARAGSVLSGRHAAIVDATFLNAADRFAIEAVARSVGVPFVGLWLKAPEGARLDRVQRRLADPSDADASVILHQSVDGSVDWTHVDASRPLDLVAGEARRSVAAAGALRRT